MDRCRWSQCVQLVKTLRLLCILTFFVHYLTLRWRDPKPPRLRSNFNLDISRPTNICFDTSRWEKHNGVWITALTPFVLKLFTKSHMPIWVLDLILEPNVHHKVLTDLMPVNWSLNWKKNSWHKVLNIYVLGFASSRATRSFFFLEALPELGAASPLHTHTHVRRRKKPHGRGFNTLVDDLQPFCHRQRV